MTVEDAIADAVVARLVPIVEGIVRDQLAPVVAALRATSAPESAHLTVRQYAKHMDLSMCSVRRRVADGTIAHVRVGGAIRIPASALQPTDPMVVATLAREARR